MINAHHLTERKASVYLEQDPARMSDINVWKGLCAPRSGVFCEKQCGDRPCGYYREAKKRNLDLEKLNARKPRSISVAVSLEEIMELKAFRKLMGWQVDELCERIGISRRTYINYISGKPVTPRIKGMVRKVVEQDA